MSSKAEDEGQSKRRIPFYQVVDGFRIPGIFSPESFRAALLYEPRPDDLIIATYPKCGTTWVQNIVACIFKNGKPFESAIEFLTQTPFLEMVGPEAAKTMKGPGALKVHLPFHLTPWSPKAKYIFVARNPKDCCVSFYHFTENVSGYEYEGASFDDFFELFIEGETDFGDYFDTVMSWYEHRNDPNVLFITYEELKKDITTGVLKIAGFMGPNYKQQYISQRNDPNVLFITYEELKKDITTGVLKIAGFMGPNYKEVLEKDEKLLHDIIHHTSFTFMKENLNKHLAELQNLPKDLIRNNPDLPPGMRALFGGERQVFKDKASDVTFVRKGVVGDWRNYFSPEQNARLEKKFKERMGNTELAEIWKNDMGLDS